MMIGAPAFIYSNDRLTPENPRIIPDAISVPKTVFADCMSADEILGLSAIVVAPRPTFRFICP